MLDIAVDEVIRYFLPLILANTFIGLVSWPFTSLFFKRLNDKGYVIAHILGWICLSYFYFIIGTFIGLGDVWFFLCVIVWILVNLAIELKTEFLRTNFSLKIIFWTQSFIVLLMLFWYVVRGFNAEVHSIERIFDYGVLQTLENATSLPLPDVWFSGESWNYYYFGHFIGHVILKFSNVPLLQGFFVLVCWLFSMLSVSVFQLGKEIYLNYQLKKGRGIVAVAGLSSFLFYSLSGNIYVLTYLVGKLMYILGFISIKPSFWYPEATRYVSGTIMEMPVYGFFVSDLHAHVWGAFVSVVVFALLYVIFIDNKSGLSFKSEKMYLLSFLFGVVFMTNSWDTVSLGILFSILFMYKYGYEIKKAVFTRVRFQDGIINVYKIWRPFIVLTYIPIGAVMVSRIWSYYYKSAVAGLGVVKTPTSLNQWLLHWGSFVFCSILFFVKDILIDGEYYRANTVFKFTFQVWLWLSICSGTFMAAVLTKLKGSVNRLLIGSVFICMFAIQLYYPYVVFKVTKGWSLEFKGINEGLHWFESKYPYDYEAYAFLKKYRDMQNRGEKMKIIVEADGDSYEDNNLFSALLGWPSVVGWPVHEWTWRGSYGEVDVRRRDVRSVYLDDDVNKTKMILRKYNVDFIIVGEIEEDIYSDGSMQMDKLLAMGNVFFQNEKTTIIKVNKDIIVR
ncbi:hypothetical protein JXA34_02960 [Patescibacteria group bacterium]|nr:hypothetical protein [Patescibacteria group bacterium]